MGVAIAAHAVLSQLMYAGVLGNAGMPADQLRGAATLMYYGGDLAELALTIALLTTWRPTPRAPRHSNHMRTRTRTRRSDQQPNGVPDRITVSEVAPTLLDSATGAVRYRADDQHRRSAHRAPDLSQRSCTAEPLICLRAYQHFHMAPLTGLIAERQL